MGECACGVRGVRAVHECSSLEVVEVRVEVGCVPDGLADWHGLLIEADPDSYEKVQKISLSRQSPNCGVLFGSSLRCAHIYLEN